MSLKALVWFVLVGFMAIAGAMAASSQARAQDRLFAGCIKIDDCSLSGKAIVDLTHSPNNDVGTLVPAANYGSVTLPARTIEITDLAPDETHSINEYMIASTSPRLTSRVLNVSELYLDGVNMTEGEDGTGVAFYNTWDQPGNAPAFSYRFNHRWGFRADDMKGGGPVLEAIAAGSRSNGEDFLWHLSNPDFSVNLGLVRHF